MGVVTAKFKKWTLKNRQKTLQQIEVLAFTEIM